MLDLELLIDLGLSPKEAEIVVHMANSLRTSGAGYFQAPTLASEVGVPREKIYTYLKKLQARGVLESIGSRPKSFSLRPIPDILDSLVASKRGELEDSLSQIAERAEEAKKAEYASLLPRVSILRDRAQYVRAMIDIIRTSERVMIVARTSALILPWERDSGPAGLLESYRNTLLDRARSGKVRVDYFISFDYTRSQIINRARQSSSEARAAIRAIRELCEGQHPNVSVRNMSNVPAISIIIGSGKVAAGFTSEEEARTAKGVLVESRDFYEFMSSIYGLLVSQPDSSITGEMVEILEAQVNAEAQRELEEALDRGDRTDG